MHAFDSKTGWSRFEFEASPHEPVFLVGDFNGWRPSALQMNYVGDRWRLRFSKPACAPVVRSYKTNR